jgi:hypothetical protein
MDDLNVPHWVHVPLHMDNVLILKCTYNTARGSHHYNTLPHAQVLEPLL